ncbi:MAG TPA: response regulator transcription factor [Polyangiales bacterium]|nr:response regulator transcription factor [Polyangiales bacterium]
MAQRILLVEDDSSIVIGLRMNLEREGYEVELAEDGDTALDLVREGGFDLVLLDVMLPKRNGYEVLDALRKEGNTTTVLMLSARSAEMDKVMGLDLGADDYIPKPFSVAELLARVRVALRRGRNTQADPPSLWRMGDIEIDPDRHQVRKAGKDVELTAKEFEVLMLLKQAAGRVLSRQAIFDRVWGDSHHGTLRTIDNFISQLRSKLEDDAANPRHILTVRGVGYRLDTTGSGT